MERKIGEVFEHNGVLLEVVKQEWDKRNSCEGCYFNGSMFCSRNDERIGDCLYLYREDEESVVFKKRKE